MPTYVYAGCRPWSRSLFKELALPGEWRFVETPDELASALSVLRPRFTFFLHWNWKVPAAMLEMPAGCECVCFHMTDVPYGRGGSPLQNLIAAGHRTTMLSALRMVDEMDAGPVYLKRPLDLSGTAEAVYVRATRLAHEMMAEIIATEPEPVPQAGEVVAFKRRRPADSDVTGLRRLDALYDHIRMLDAEGYPHAYLVAGGFRLEFTRASLYAGRLVADVTITEAP